MNYELSYKEKHNLNENALTDAQRTLHFIAENMRMEKSISEDGYKHFQQAIEALSCSENPNKSKTGHWINNQNGTFECDQCGCKHSKSRFCPSCGAKMVESQERNDDR